MERQFREQLELLEERGGEWARERVGLERKNKDL